MPGKEERNGFQLNDDKDSQEGNEHITINQNNKGALQ